MKNLLKVAIAVCAAVAAMSTQVNAQTVQLKGLGSSAYFLEAGLGANYSGGLINAPCVWSLASGTVAATDTKVTPSAVDNGQVWVAWTTGGTTYSCESPSTSANVYAYLQTDSVVGNRCLFNSTTCTIAGFPNSGTSVPAKLILSAIGTNCSTAGATPNGECDLPTSIANALNSAAVNFAGTDIRPEDAEFAITRATTACGTAVATGSQYLGLGYSKTAGDRIGSYNYNPTVSPVTGSYFNVVNFTLPSTFYVNVVGAIPIVVAANGTGISTGSISAHTLAYLLDGTYSYTGQVSSSPSATGSPLWVYLREPLSGTYNTMEYNIPNTTVFTTSQDVGQSQPSGQINCSGSVPKGLVSGTGSGTSYPASYDLNISTTSGGARQRQIGTGAELKAVVTNANSNSLGYGFWSVANFAGFTSSATPNAKYLQIVPYGSSTAIDPLLNSSTTYTGAIPTTGSEIKNVDLHTTREGTYPIWSLLRIVTTSSAASTLAGDLASATDDFVSFGATTSRPDFVTPDKIDVVRSHFTPPAIAALTNPLANGDWQLNDGTSTCTLAPESGGDVGGVVLALYSPNPFNGHADDSDYCTANPTKLGGQTGLRN
jgi:hypothetical protein